MTVELEDILAISGSPRGQERLHDKGLCNEEGINEILEGAEDVVQRDQAAAETLARFCDEISTAMGLWACSARAAYLLARVSTQRGQLDDALRLIDRARQAWLRSGDDLAALRTDLGRMNVLDDLGRHEEAARTGSLLITSLESLSIRSDQHDQHLWLRAAALENLGVARSYAGHLEEALRFYDQAAATYRAMGRVAETARPLANRGVDLLALGRAREALLAFSQAVDAFEEKGDKLWAAKCSGDVARAHYLLGEFAPALRALARARETIADLDAPAEEARLQLAEAAVYLDLGLMPEADAAAAGAAAVTSRAGMLHDSALARYLQAIANLEDGHTPKAREHLEAAAMLFERVEDQRYQARCKLVAADLAAADREEAASLALAAVAGLRDTTWAPDLAWALLRSAEFAEPASAATLLTEAAAVANPLRLPILDYHLSLQRGRHRRLIGSPADAEKDYRRAAQIVDRIGNTMPDHALRSAFRENKLAAHDGLVDLLVDRGTGDASTEASAIADAAKSQTLADLLGGSTSLAARSADRSPETTEMAEAHRELNALYVALHDSQPGHRSRLQKRARSLEKRVGTLHARISTNATPARQPRRPESVTEQRPAPVLAFHIVGPDIVAFMIRRNGVTSRRLRGALTTVDADLEEINALWSRFRVGTEFLKRHETALRTTAVQVLSSLYETLIAPVEEMLDEQRDQPLRIVPHRQLGNVPFQALHDGSDFLLARRTLTMAPTANGMPMRAEPLDLSSMVIIAADDARAPNVVNEAQRIAELVPQSRLVLGDRATSEALLGLEGAPSVLHIACHGVHREDNPLFSRIRLSDRWVTTSEILNLDLRGTLVTLSSCESGRHGHTAEPVGMAWAFLAAGARAVVSSRWVVSDEATSDLMAAFYRGLVDGRDPDSALRSAQLEMAAERPHPFHWAPFNVVWNIA